MSYCPQSFTGCHQNTGIPDSSCSYKFRCPFRSSLTCFSPFFHSSRKKVYVIVHNCPKLWNPESAVWDVTLYDNSGEGKTSTKYSVSRIKGISLRYWTTVKSFIFPRGRQYSPFPFSCLGEWLCFHSEGHLLLS